ncbi:hypothetical protein KP509_30G063000 [Ceratopteris richardii]|uniref:Uncharacterized protein n=1 Tax=Ceratopteris richardii TaxID=49495 RepID=A0A8T2R4U5_CERRI|nr:hypothetical protein KP509_30G063000 [Ceratopteris richardii]
MGHRGDRFFWRVVLHFATFFLLARVAEPAVLSIDLGSEWMKVSVVNIKPGQNPISIAINEMSKRKTPSLVAFSGGDMLVGEAAAGISARYPDRVYSQLQHLIGKKVEEVQKYLNSQYFPYTIVEDNRGSFSFRITDEESVFSPEELLAILLSHAKSLGEAHAKVTIKDAVIAIPPYLGQTERECITVAAELGGLNVLALVNQHSGIALQYGIDKDFVEDPRYVLFYDMGAKGVYAALVYYSAYTTKEFGKNKTVNQFQVKEVSWDASLGGYTMELRLLEHFVDIFNKEIGDGVDLRNFPKALAKLKKQIKRTKEILSANTEAVLSVEGLHDNRDFRAPITRRKFEELCEDLWERALIPIKQVLEASKLSLEQLHSVELVGGATRVPKLQSTLSDFLGKTGHERHLDADEAVALGAALHAANLSDGIKMNKKLGMIDGASYSMLMKIDSMVADSTEDEIKEVLVPRLKKFPSKVFKSTSHGNDFKVSVFYDAFESFPPGVGSKEIAVFEVLGVSEAYAKHGSRNLSSPMKTNLHFSLSRSGILSFDKAETVVEFSEWIEVPAKNQAKNETKATSEKPNVSPENVKNETERKSKDVSSSTDLGTPQNETTSEQDVPVIMEKKLRKRTIRVPLKIKDSNAGLVRPLSIEARMEASIRLDKINRREEEKRMIAEAKNSLESYIYSMKEKLESVDGIEKVTTGEQRDKFHEELNEAGDWLYEEEQTASEYKNRLDALKAVGDAILLRLKEIEARPAAVEFALTYIGDIKETLSGWSQSKPWIGENKKKELMDAADALQSWLEEKQLEQDKKQAHEDLAFLSEDVYLKVTKLEQKFSKLSKTPKPKVVEKTEGTKGSESTSSSQGGDSSSSSPQESAEAQRDANDRDKGTQGEDVKQQTSEDIHVDDIKEGVNESDDSHDEL